MPLPSSINDLSTTAASNSPAGSESSGTADDYLRTYAAYIASLRDVVLSGTASVSTLNITYTGTLTGGTGVVNIGSGQVYKDASGNFGFGHTAPSSMLHTKGGQVRIQATIDASNGLLQFLDAGGTVRGNLYAGGSGYFALETPGAVPMNINTNGVTRVQVKSTGQVKFVPLASAPSGQEAGDMYFNSTTSKMQVYTGSAWVDLH